MASHVAPDLTDSFDIKGMIFSTDFTTVMLHIMTTAAAGYLRAHQEPACLEVIR